MTRQYCEYSKSWLAIFTILSCGVSYRQYCSAHYNTLQHTATHTTAHCNTLQHYSILQHTATHTTAHCNTLPRVSPVSPSRHARLSMCDVTTEWHGRFTHVFPFFFFLRNDRAHMSVAEWVTHVTHTCESVTRVWRDSLFTCDVTYSHMSLVPCEWRHVRVSHMNRDMWECHMWTETCESVTCEQRHVRVSHVNRDMWEWDVRERHVSIHSHTLTEWECHMWTETCESAKCDRRGKFSTHLGPSRRIRLVQNMFCTEHDKFSKTDRRGKFSKCVETVLRCSVTKFSKCAETVNSSCESAKCDRRGKFSLSTHLENFVTEHLNSEFCVETVLRCSVTKFSKCVETVNSQHIWRIHCWDVQWQNSPNVLTLPGRQCSVTILSQHIWVLLSIGKTVAMFSDNVVSTHLGPSRRIRLVQNTISCHHSGTMKFKFN